MGDQALLLGDEQRVAFLADANAIDGTPELFEGNLSDDPGRFLTSRHHAYRNRRAGESVFVQLQRSNEDSVGVDAARLGNRQGRSVDSARGENSPSAGKERDFPEFRKVEDVVLEDRLPAATVAG